MNQVKYIFSQIIEFLNEDKFRRIVSKYNGDHYVKHYTCWNQLVTLIFGQLSRSASLRDVVIVLQAHRSKLYHLGIGKSISRSNLSKANEQRDYRIFEDFAYYMIAEARRKRAIDKFGLDGNVYAFDSTTIDLCLSLFTWAKFRKKKGGIKVHTMFDVQAGVPTFAYITEAKVNDINAMDEIPYERGSYYIFDRGYNDFSRLYLIRQLEAYFVVRAKKNVCYKRITWKRRLQDNVLSDSTICFTGFYPKDYYPEPLRLVRYWDEENRREFIFLTNNFDLTALEVAELYHNRWQIELFFKWLKQHLKIKHFYGTSLNAVKIQIFVAIITFCLVAIVQHDMKLELTTYELLHVLSVSLTGKMHLTDLLNKTNFQNDKEHLDSSEPLLFDLNF